MQKDLTEIECKDLFGMDKYLDFISDAEKDIIKVLKTERTLERYIIGAKHYCQIPTINGNKYDIWIEFQATHNNGVLVGIKVPRIIIFDIMSDEILDRYNFFQKGFQLETSQ